MGIKWQKETSGSRRRRKNDQPHSREFKMCTHMYSIDYTCTCNVVVLCACDCLCSVGRATSLKAGG